MVGVEILRGRPSGCQKENGLPVPRFAESTTLKNLIQLLLLLIAGVSQKEPPWQVRKGHLNRPGGRQFGNAEFIPSMGCKSVVGHQLIGNLSGQRWFQSATDVDCCQLVPLRFIIRFQFSPLAVQVGLFCIRLRTDGNLFSGRHRHRTCKQTKSHGCYFFNRRWCIELRSGVQVNRFWKGIGEE